MDLLKRTTYCLGHYDRADHACAKTALLAGWNEIQRHEEQSSANTVLTPSYDCFRCQRGTVLREIFKMRDAFVYLGKHGKARHMY